MTDMDYKRAILTALNQRYPSADASAPMRKAHKINLLGRNGFQDGELATQMGVSFTSEDRAKAARAFDVLRRDGYIESTYDDLVDPENWVHITASGQALLARDMRDDIDDAILLIGAHLPELRQGMKDAAARESADSARQAANSARELIDQVLKEGAPGLDTRKERFRSLMLQQHGGTKVSSADLDVLEAQADLVEAEHTRMLKEAHARYLPSAKAARACVDAAERILSLIFSKD